MYAVIETGGKQYKVTPGEVIEIEKLPVEVGATVKLDRVLLVQTDGELRVGNPTIRGATVTGQVMGQERSPKVVVFKKKRRKNYRRTKGHRQSYTRFKITEINTAS
jgi:large subunit ribosomal protein L21